MFFYLQFFAKASHIFQSDTEHVQFVTVLFDQIQQNCILSALKMFWDVWRQVCEIQIFKAASIILDIRCSSSTFTSESI